MKASSALFLVLIAAGCGTSSSPSAVPTRAGAAELVSRVRSIPAFATRISAGQSIVRRAGSYTVSGGFRVVGAPAVRVEVPSTATESLRFVDDTQHLAWGVRALDLATKTGESTDGALVYQDVAKDTDLVLHAVPSGVEELRVLRSADAPHTFRWSVEHGSARVSDVLEIRDERGAVRMRGELPFAIDARGVRRELALRVEGSVVVAELDVAGLTYPIVVDPVWQTVVSTLPAPLGYYAYTWVTANANTVLQLGGSNNSTTGTGMFDVPTQKWTAIPLTSARTWSKSLWVPSIGKALITGGLTGGGSLVTTAALVDYTASPAVTELSGTMTVGRAHHTMTLVAPGGAERVLVVGGGDGAGTLSVDWFEPSTFTFTARAPMATARTRHAATRLVSGKVLVTGGRTGATGALASAEVYDPVANTWTAVSTSMANGRYSHTQSLLPDGRVLIIGGLDALAAPTSTTSIYDPTSNSIAPGPSLGYERSEHAATTLADGRILVTGGYGRAAGTTGALVSLQTTEIYDSTSGGFTPGPTMNGARKGHDAVALSGGRVMVGTASGLGSTEILWPDATACSGTSSSCPICVDGVCCDTSCTGQCEACDVAGKQGVCSPVTGEAPHGSRAACSPFAVCVYSTTTATSSCATTCTADASCASGSYCVNPGSSGTCAPKKAVGDGCTGANQCTSGKCVDGACCSSDCTGQCQSCGESGSLGTCASVDGMPRGTRTACATPYACSAGACATSCTKDVECATGRACDIASSTCVAKKANGATCTAAQQCISGQCIDGVCCNTDCTSACFACDVAGKAGTCSAVADGSAPRGARTCAPFARCGAAGACKTSCTSGADCVSGICDSATNTCSATVTDAGGDAPADVSTDAAVVDAIVDTTVADTSVADTSPTDTNVSPTDTGDDRGIATSPAPDPGPKPTVPEFLRCTKSSDCASGHCVEGVCCDSACTDRCRSCALLGSPGKCTLEPMGVDLKNECGPAFTCLGTCSGSGECIGAGNGTMCARNRCTGPSTGVGPGYCPAPGGKCATDDVVPFDCAPYICEPAFGACVSSCKATTDCANGFVCDVETKTCVAPPAAAVEEGGCAYGPRSSRGGSAVLLGALSALVLARRRSREIGPRRA